ncbi:unnamed protein product [Effrenium voratum]|uniref:Uncharacterized protein n=1 Tax=Effrenium voratum TaxID=2562239 RepID=A0AA36I3I1_9DINO|nr:unnamed protein product [Effrenium voratum]
MAPGAEVLLPEQRVQLPRSIGHWALLPLVLLPPAAVLGFFAWGSCGSNSSLKEGQTLHVISDQQLLKKIQAGSGCDPCAAAGQAVTVVRVPESWEYVLVRLPSGEELSLAPEALGLWCGPGWQVGGLVTAVMSCASFLICGPIAALLVAGNQSLRRELQASLEAGHTEVYHLVLSGRAAEQFSRMVYGPGGTRREKILALFPWLDFGSPLVIYICIAAIPGCRLQLCITAAAMVALVLLARIGLWLHCTLRYLRRASPEQTAEISICGFPQSQRPKVCIIYDQQMLVCFNVGNLPAVLPANMISMPALSFLARMQLVACHEVRGDDTSPIIGWNLKVGYCVWSENKWVARWKAFPVDPARLHELQRWLTQHRQLFRFQGVALRSEEVIDQRQVRLPLQAEEIEDGLPEALTQTRVFTLGRCLWGPTGAQPGGARRGSGGGPLLPRGHAPGEAGPSGEDRSARWPDVGQS